MSTGSNPKVTGTNTSGLYGSTGQTTVSSGTYGNAQVAAFLESYTGNLSAGNASVSGNVAAGGVLTDNYYYANGAPVSFAGTYGNANVAAYLPTYTGNLAGGNAAISGTITAATVSASGNITGSYILGNGSQLTGLPASYSNANVTTLLAAFGSNTISTTGNITAGYFIGDGSQLTGLPASYGNANVAAYLPTYTGNLQAGNLATINNANINNDLYVGGTIYGTFSGNISGNLVVPGANTEVIFNDAGNAGASADFTFNDATNVMTVNGTANVSTLNVSGTAAANTVTASTGVNTPQVISYSNLSIVANGANINMTPVSMPIYNINMATPNVNITGGFGGNSNVSVTGQVSVTGNITGANIIGNGQSLTNLPGANVTGTVANAAYATSAGSAATATHATTANTVTDAAQANITSVGTLTGLTVGGDQNITGNLIVGENLTVNGNTISVNITELNVQDPIIGLGRGENNAPLTSNDGKDRGEQLWYYAGSEKSAFTGYDNSAGNLILATDVAIANEIVSVNTWGTTELGDLYAHGNVTANIFAGQLSGNVIQPLQFGIEAIGNPANSVSVYGNGVGIQSYTDQDINILSTTTNSHINMVTFGSGVDSDINIGALSGATANVRIRGANLNAEQNISATGNITGANVIGNGQYLTNITGANVTGTVANATYATTAGSATTAATVTGNAQANITSVGTLTTLSVSGNIGTGGILTDNYYYANGTPISFGGTYGNADVSNFLANGFGSNTITTSGNVSFGNINVTGTITSNTGAVKIQDDVVLGGSTTPVTISGSLGTLSTVAVVGSYAANIFNGDTAGSGLKIQAGASSSEVLLDLYNVYGVSIANIKPGYGMALTGVVRAGAVTYTNTDGSAGQVLTTYGNGTTYFSTVSGGNATPAGSNTYVQFNDGGAFGGDADFAYDKTTNQLTLAGNANVGNLNATTSIRVSGSAGNISGANYIIGNYFVGDGGLLTNVASSGNSFSTIDANGTAIVADSSSDTLTLTAGTGITITGNATTDTITIAATGGGGSPGGSDTQIQFNDSSTFGGNANVTFNKTTGNLTAGNIRFQTGTANSTTAVYQNWIQQANPMVGNIATNTTYWASRYLLGGGLGGNPGSGGAGLFSDAATADSNQRAARVYLADRYTKTDTGVRSTAFAIENWVDVSGNVGTSNNNSRIQGISSAMYVGGNGAGNLNGSTTTLRNINASVNAGTSGNTNVGNINIASCSVYTAFQDVRPGSTMGNVVMYQAGLQNNTGNTANLGHFIGFAPSSGGNATATTFSLIWLGNTSPVNGIGMSTSFTPANYYFLNNTDLRSSSKVGPIQEYYDRTYTFTTTTGSADLNWTNGTAQYVQPTGNMTLSFTGPTVSSNGNLFHTVTLVVAQGATPYTITLPAASSTIKYAGGVGTVGATANAVSMITVTAANIAGSTTYLATVSPEFS